MSFIVAIDGPAGTGKGTLAKNIAEKFNLINIDTGAMFRCVALEFINRKISQNDDSEIEKLLNEIDIKLESINHENRIFLNGKDVTERIRENDVNDLVSPISVIKDVREKLAEMQRKIAKGQDVIMEGRDIGTAIFPNADVKIYLDATPEERAKRRMKQNEEKGIKTSFEEALKNILDRDTRDSNRAIAPLKKADDAINIDSTNMTIDEVVEEVSKIIKNKKNLNKGV